MHVTAHISDLHIHDARSLARAEAVMRYLRGLSRPVDAIVVTGDLADHGSVEEYATVADLLKADSPVLHCPGNHDDRARYRHGLHGEPGTAPINRRHEIGGVSYLLCDSTIPGADHGRLDAETLDWITATLEAHPRSPAYLCLHHPPIPLGLPYPDSLRMDDPEPLARIVRSHPHVAAILCGHIHSAAFTRFADRPLLVAPGVASTANLGFVSPAIIDRTAPPAVAFHLRDDDGRISSHVRFVQTTDHESGDDPA